MPRIPQGEINFSEAALLQHMDLVSQTLEGTQVHPCPPGPVSADAFDLTRCLIPAMRGGEDPSTDPDALSGLFPGSVTLSGRLTSLNALDHLHGHEMRRAGPDPARPLDNLMDLAVNHDSLALERRDRDYTDRDRERFIEPWKATLEAHLRLTLRRWDRPAGFEDTDAANERDMRTLASTRFLANETLVDQMKPLRLVDPAYFPVGDLLIEREGLLHAIRQRKGVDSIEGIDVPGLVCMCGAHVQRTLAQLGGHFLQADQHTIARRHTYSDALVRAAGEDMLDRRAGHTCGHIGGMLPEMVAGHIRPLYMDYMKRVGKLLDVGLLEADDVMADRGLFDRNTGLIEFAFSTGAWMFQEFRYRLNNGVRATDQYQESNTRVVLMPVLEAFTRIDLPTIKDRRDMIRARAGQAELNMFPLRAMSQWVDTIVYDERRTLKWLRRNAARYLHTWRRLMRERRQMAVRFPSVTDTWYPATFKAFQEAHADTGGDEMSGSVTPARLPETFNRLRSQLAGMKARNPGLSVTLSRTLIELIEPFVAMGHDLEERMQQAGGKTRNRYRFRFVDWKEHGVSLDNARLVDMRDNLEVDLRGTRHTREPVRTRRPSETAKLDALAYARVFEIAGIVDLLEACGYDTQRWPEPAALDLLAEEAGQ